MKENLRNTIYTIFVTCEEHIKKRTTLIRRFAHQQQRMLSKRQV